jgi:hypothetical protein
MHNQTAKNKTIKHFLGRRVFYYFLDKLAYIQSLQKRVCVSERERDRVREREGGRERGRVMSRS